MKSISYRRAAALLCLIVIIATLGTGVGYAYTAPESDSTPRLSIDQTTDRGPLSDAGTLQVDDPSTNNTTRVVSQQDPDEVDARVNLEFMRSVLADKLSNRLAVSTVLLRSSSYDRAREVVGPEYRETFEIYVSVVDDIEVDADPSDSPFQRAGRDQRAFVTSVTRYEETYREYRAAKASGNSDRVRRLARELDTVAPNVSTRGETLTETYQNVSDVASYDMAPYGDDVDQITGNITERQTDVREEEFVRTELVLSPENERISFSDPLVLSGHVETENGSVVENETLRFRLENRTYTVETNNSSEFTLRYRPTTLPLETRAVTVQYLPSAESAYLGSNDSVPVEVEQVTPTIEVTDGPAVAGYDDPMNISGRVHVDGIPARGVPLIIRVGTTSLETVETDAEGRFQTQSNLSASARPGRRNISAVVDLRDRALTGARDVRPLRVETTPTSLTLSTGRAESDALRAAGSLRLADGRPVPDQTVEILIDGDETDTVRTDADGDFSTTVVVRESALSTEGNTTLDVVAVFDGTGTNLDSSQASTRQTMQRQSSRSSGGRFSATLNVLDEFTSSLRQGAIFIPLLNQRVSFGVLILFGLVFGSVLYTGSTVFSSKQHADEPISQAHDADASQEAVSDTVSRTITGEALDAIFEDGSRDDAVVGLYGLVRQRLSDEFDVPDRGTHREFRLSLPEHDPDIDLEVFDRLTEYYERAAFAQAETDESTAGEAREAAEELLE